MRRQLLYLCWTAVLCASQTPVLQAQEASYRGGLVTPPLPKPKFVLSDTSGAPFQFWPRTQGYVTLLFFGYTYCPDQCPMHMANIGVALKRLPAAIADQVKLVFVTTDPARDTPAELRRWLDNFDKRFVGLTGRPLSSACRKPQACPWPEKQDLAAATIQSSTPTSSWRTRKTIWRMLFIPAASVKTIGSMTCPC